VVVFHSLFSGPNCPQQHRVGSGTQKHMSQVRQVLSQESLTTETLMARHFAAAEPPAVALARPSAPREAGLGGFRVADEDRAHLSIHDNQVVDGVSLSRPIKNLAAARSCERYIHRSHHQNINQR